MFLLLDVNANESVRNSFIESYFTDCKLIYDQVIIDYFIELEYEVSLIEYNDESCTEAIVETTSLTKFLVTLSGGGIVGCEEIR